jgi:hypothetical protein
MGHSFYLLKSWPLGLFLSLYPLVCLVVMLRFRDSLQDQVVIDRIGQMYNGVSLIRHKYTVLYYPTFMWRRFIFIVIPIMVR